ncbi:MAG: hypothetical protein AAGA99_25515 [Actinomycetota bacterium]
MLETLGEDPATWDEVSVPHGPGRRLTVHGRSVAGFHLFGVDDIGDPRDGAIVIYLIDIWTDEFP